MITNLLQNARDAVGSRGQVTVRTAMGTDGRRSQLPTMAVDESRILRDSLFRPFQTTKKKVWDRHVSVENDRGGTSREHQVKSELGIGTTFRVMLPLNPK